MEVILFLDELNRLLENHNSLPKPLSARIASLDNDRIVIDITANILLKPTIQMNVFNILIEDKTLKADLSFKGLVGALVKIISGALKLIPGINLNTKKISYPIDSPVMNHLSDVNLSTEDGRLTVTVLPKEITSENEEALEPGGNGENQD
ncbi:MAG: hypothetical protein P9X24_17725 [Candidatus Hatepunaea meridiana]|nr:hypothetical protein [Candidatus Hatepunaea meridiana]